MPDDPFTPRRADFGPEKKPAIPEPRVETYPQVSVVPLTTEPNSTRADVPANVPATVTGSVPDKAAGQS